MNLWLGSAPLVLPLCRSCLLVSPGSGSSAVACPGCVPWLADSADRMRSRPGLPGSHGLFASPSVSLPPPLDPLRWSARHLRLRTAPMCGLCCSPISVYKLTSVSRPFRPSADLTDLRALHPMSHLSCFFEPFRLCSDYGYHNHVLLPCSDLGVVYLKTEKITQESTGGKKVLSAKYFQETEAAINTVRKLCVKNESGCLCVENQVIHYYYLSKEGWGVRKTPSSKCSRLTGG